VQRSIFYVNHKKRQTDRQHSKASLLYSGLDVFLRIHDDEMGFLGNVVGGGGGWYVYLCELVSWKIFQRIIYFNIFEVKQLNDCRCFLPL